jgi:hypothetical protein
VSSKIDDWEFKLINSIQRDDVLLLSKKEVNFEKLDGKKLGQFIQNLVGNGAILAYVTETRTPKNLQQNYATLLLSTEGYEGLSEVPEKYNVYKYTSLLTYQR